MRVLEKAKFKKHETFYFREGWLAKALVEIYSNNNTELFNGTNGILKLGIGANMVKSVKYWLSVCNLYKYNKSNREYKLTDMAESIAQHDIYLEDIFSIWLLHLNLISNDSDGATWYVFFNLFEGERFSLEDIKSSLRAILENKNVKFPDKSLDSDISILLSMYSKGEKNDDPEENLVCPLSRLKLLKYSMGTYIKNVPDLQDLDELVVLYAILLIMKKEENKNYINISELEDGEMSLASMLNLNRIIINEYLDKLSNLGYIRLEKTAGLDMLYLEKNIGLGDIPNIYFEGKGNI